MDALNYGAIKNLDKKLGLSMGEVGSNFGMTYGDKLINFDGFASVTQQANVKSINQVISTTIPATLSFAVWNASEKVYYAIDMNNSKQVKYNPLTGALTTIRTLSAALIQAINNTLVSMAGYGMHNSVDYNSDYTKFVVINWYSTFAFVLVDLINGTATKTTVATPQTVTIDGSSVAVQVSNNANCYYDFTANILYMPYNDGASYKVGMVKINSAGIMDANTIHITRTSNLYGPIQVYFDKDNKKAYGLYKDTTSPWGIQLFIYDLVANTVIMRAVTINGGVIASNTISCTLYPAYCKIGNNVYFIIACDTGLMTYAGNTLEGGHLFSFDVTRADAQLELISTKPFGTATVYTNFNNYYAAIYSNYFSLFANNGRPEISIVGDNLLFIHPTQTINIYADIYSIATKSRTYQWANSTAFGMSMGNVVLTFDTTLPAVKTLQIPYGLSPLIGSNSINLTGVGNLDANLVTITETLALITTTAAATIEFTIGTTVFNRILGSTGDTIILHSKTGIKIRVLSGTITDLLWGCK